MGVYVVTGSASGMGRSTAEQLRWEGHEVIGVDLRNAEIIADLSTADGRQKAIEKIYERAGGRLDGAVLAAGLGPVPGRERLIAEVNYCGVVMLLEGLRDLLAAAGNAKVVIFSSNSTTTVPGVPQDLIDGFLARDMDTVFGILENVPEEVAPTFMYAASKTAVTHWMRTIGVDEEWAGAGIRVNALAPGAIRTPLLEQQLNDPKLRGAIESFPIPVRDFGKPEEVAKWAIFMLSPAANFLCGSVIFLDGGTDAYFRANSWPKAVPVEETAQFQQRAADFAALVAEEKAE